MNNVPLVPKHSINAPTTPKNHNMNNIEITSARGVSKSKSSYSSQLRMKQTKSSLYNYEIALLETHIHSGMYHENKRHGEGVTIMDNGTAVLGNWYQGKL